MKLRINESQPNEIKNEAFNNAKAKANAEYLAKIKAGFEAIRQGKGVVYNFEDEDDEQNLV